MRGNQDLNFFFWKTDLKKVTNALFHDVYGPIPSQSCFWCSWFSSEILLKWSCVNCQFVKQWFSCRNDPNIFRFKLPLSLKSSFESSLNKNNTLTKSQALIFCWLWVLLAMIGCLFHNSTFIDGSNIRTFWRRILPIWWARLHLFFEYSVNRVNVQLSLQNLSSRVL